MADEKLDTLKKLVDWVNGPDVYERYKRCRAPFEKTWQRNMAFCMGNHYIDLINNRFVEIKTPTWRVNLVANLVFGIWRILLAKLLRTEPTLYVTPASEKPESLNSAKIGMKFLKYIWRKVRMSMQLNRFASRGIIYGTAFFMPFFNTNKGKIANTSIGFSEYDFSESSEGRAPWIEQGQQVTSIETKKPLFIKVDGDGNPIIKHYRIGEADVDVCYPGEIYPCPDATDDPDTLTSFIREKVRTVDWVKETFGMEVKPDTTYDGSADQQIDSIVNDDGQTQEKKKNGVTVRDYVEAPGKYPKGRIITVTPDHPVPLQNRDLPPEALKLDPPIPLIPWRFITVPGRFWGASVLEHVIPLQVQYNKMRSRVIEHVNRMSKGKWIIASQSKIESPITDEGSQIIRHFAGAWQEPHQMDIKPLPNYIFENIASLQQEIYDVSGIHEVSHSRTPRGVRSGTAIAVLQEMDDTSLGPTVAAFAEAIEQLGIAWLQIARERYTEPRMLAVVGKNEQFFLEKFMGTMLEDGADVLCQIGSALPQSPLARLETYKELYRLRAISAKKLLFLLDMTTGDDLQEQEKLDEIKAKIENDLMATGHAREVAPYDNPIVHIKILNDFRRQPLYDTFPDQIKYIFSLHEEAHKEQMKTPGAISPDALIAMQKEMAESGAGSPASMPQA